MPDQTYVLHSTTGPTYLSLMRALQPALPPAPEGVQITDMRPFVYHEYLVSQGVRIYQEANRDVITFAVPSEDLDTLHELQKQFPGTAVLRAVS